MAENKPLVELDKVARAVQAGPVARFRTPHFEDSRCPRPLVVKLNGREQRRQQTSIRILNHLESSEPFRKLRFVNSTDTRSEERRKEGYEWTGRVSWSPLPYVSGTAEPFPIVLRDAVFMRAKHEQ